VWPEFSRFVEEYRGLLRDRGEDMADADAFEAELMAIYYTGSDDPIAIENWDNFLSLLRGPGCFKTKFMCHGDILRSGWSDWRRKPGAMH
jgi:hypothetical protein